MRQQIGFKTAVVFRAVANGNRFGLDVMRATGLPSGTVYPTLTRAELAGYVHARWENEAVATREGRPRRRLYELTAAGRSVLDASHARFAEFVAHARGRS